MYDNSEGSLEESSKFHFKVVIKTYMAILYVVIIVVCLCFGYPMRYLGLLEGDKTVSQVMGYFFAFVVGIMLIFYLGKRIIVSGDKITFKRWFLFSKTISVSDVDECHARYNASYIIHPYRKFNKLEIYYGGNKKFTVTDIIYDNWNEMVGYMSYHDKLVKTDESNWY